MLNWYSSVYKAFILTSVFLFILSFGTTGETTFGSLLAAYSTMILGIIMIMVVIINGLLEGIPNNQSIFKTILSVLFTTGPFLLMLAVIGVILYLTIMYKNIIESGHVADSYYTFSKITIVLFLLQIYLLYGGINSEKFNTTGNISKVTNSLIYLLSVITGICAIILYTVLTYFTTDG